MTPERSGAAGSIEVVHRYVAALESLDTEELRSCFWPDALIWHNVDQVDRSVVETLQRAVTLSAGVVERRLAIRRLDVLDDGVLLRMDAKVRPASGGFESFPAAAVLRVIDGRISRLEEYVDSRQVARAFHVRS